MAGKRFYPAFLDLTGRLVVVVGPGEALLRKAKQLSKYGADVLVITPEPSADILQAEAEGVLSIERRSYVRGDLGGAALVVCLSDDEEVRRAVAAEATQAGTPVNVAGAPQRSSFLAPSLIHREPLQIAISTGGIAPQLAKHLRKRLASEFGEEWGRFSELFAEVRALAMERLDDAMAVDGVLDAVLESNTLELVRSGEDVTAEQILARFAPQAAESDDSESNAHTGSPSAEQESEAAEA